MHRVTTATLAAGVLALCAGRVAVAATETPIVITQPPINANLQTYTGGTNYPLGPTTITVGGIPFNLAGFSPGGGTGIIQTNNSSFTIPVGLANVTTVFGLINSAFGVSGATVGSLVFTDSASDTFTFTLVEGTNVRDHFNGAFNNSATDIFATACFGGSTCPDRLDAYQITLPASFAGNTLVSIVFNGNNAAGGEPFLAGLTGENGTSVVPLPAALPLFATGLAALGLLGWRRKKKAAA